MRIISKGWDLELGPRHIKRSGRYNTGCGWIHDKHVEASYASQNIETFTIEVDKIQGSECVSHVEEQGPSNWIGSREVAEDASVGAALACALALWVGKGEFAWEVDGIPCKDVMFVTLSGQQERVRIKANDTTEHIQVMACNRGSYSELIEIPFRTYSWRARSCQSTRDLISSLISKSSN